MNQTDPIKMDISETSDRAEIREICAIEMKKMEYLLERFRNQYDRLVLVKLEKPSGLIKKVTFELRIRNFLGPVIFQERAVTV